MSAAAAAALIFIAAVLPFSAALLDDAIEILSASGFVSMALTLEVAPAALSSPSLTVFAPPDSAFVASGQPPLSLLSLHLSPSRLSPASLASLPAGARIPTLLPNHSALIVTASHSASAIALNGVAVNASSPVFDDGSTIVYPAAGFFDPDFRLQDEAPTLTCSPANSSAGDLDSFSAAAAALRSRGYSAAASLLAAQLLPPSNRSAVTIFAPTDADLGLLAGGDFAGFVGEMARHTAPCRLAWADLVLVGEATKVPTFAPGYPAVVSSKSGEFVAINGLPIAQPNIYYGVSVVVHGLGSAVSPPPSAAVVSPPTSTLSTSPSRSRTRTEDVSVQYSDFVGDGANSLDYEVMGE